MASSVRHEQLGVLSALSARAIELSPEEQERLALLVREGKDAAQKLSEGGLGTSEKIRLQRTVRAAAGAREQLSASIIRLTLVIAQDEAGKRFGAQAGNVIENIVGAGNEGAAEAILTWDPKYGVPFAKWAAGRIRHSVQAACNEHTSVISVPASWVRVGRMAARSREKLTEELGRAPTLAEIQEEVLSYCLEQQGGDHEEARKKLQRQGVLGALDHLEDVMRLTALHDSVDRELRSDGEDEEFTHLHHLSNDSHEELVRSAENAELREAIMRVLEGLDEREREIILYRYGFIDGEVWSYSKIAEQYGLSGERVRQIEAELRDRLASPTHQFVRLLQPHLENA